jgi:hypothetical protein
VGVGGVVEHQVGDDPDAAGVCLVDERDEVGDGAELRRDQVVVADVVSAVTAGRVVERRQPDAIDAEPLQIVQFGRHAGEVAVPVRGGVVTGLYEHLIEDGALEPFRFNG